MTQDNLYREHILDHYAHPRHRGHLRSPDIVADADEPSCGDQVHLEIAVSPDGRVQRLAFDGEGCMISMATASILCEHIEGGTLDELASLTEDDMLSLVDAPVGASRRPCALLPLQVLQSGLRAHSR